MSALLQPCRLADSTAPDRDHDPMGHAFNVHGLGSARTTAAAPTVASPTRACHCSATCPDKHHYPRRRRALRYGPACMQSVVLTQVPLCPWHTPRPLRRPRRPQILAVYCDLYARVERLPFHEFLAANVHPVRSPCLTSTRAANRRCKQPKQHGATRR